MEYYRNFITIVEAGSISAAAKKISIAQPALSNQLKQLQHHYDAKLIEVKRGGHRMELTDAGRVLLRKARLICDEEANASKEISDCARVSPEPCVSAFPRPCPRGSFPAT